MQWQFFDFIAGPPRNVFAMCIASGRLWNHNVPGGLYKVIIPHPIHILRAANKISTHTHTPQILSQKRHRTLHRFAAEGSSLKLASPA
jgi:hypothetical protein